MASSSTFLELTPFQWNQPLPYTQRPHHRTVLLYSKPQRRSNSIRLQISVKYKQSTSSSDPDLRSNFNPFEQIAIQLRLVVELVVIPSRRGLGALLLLLRNRILCREHRIRAFRTLLGPLRTMDRHLSVGLLGLGRTLQQDFNRLAESSDTSTPEGLSYVLTEATLALLRHPDYCISCYSSVDVKPSIEKGEKRFNQLSIEERGKFDEETLVNVNSIKRQSSKIRKASGFSNEYIVVTILMAAEGIHKLPPINGTTDLKEALLKLGSIPRNKIMAVEVLWTPQNEADALSERELLEDYPLLRPL
ncbi:Hypothetical protein [Arabidopsis thaliana]|nr:Hypothetical protein [Arabidopsis thaliana]